GGRSGRQALGRLLLRADGADLVGARHGRCNRRLPRGDCRHGPPHGACAHGAVDMNVAVLTATGAFWAGTWALNSWLAGRTPSSAAAARARDIVVPVLFGITLLVLWEGIARGFGIPAVLLPPPSMVWERITNSVPTLWADFYQTFIKAVLIGYALG